MLDLPHLNRPLAGGRLGHLNFPSEASPELLKASIQPSPSTNVPSPKSLEDTLSPRVIMPMILFRKGVIAEFLLRGIIDGGTKLPEKGSVAEEEIKSISESTLFLLFRASGSIVSHILTGGIPTFFFQTLTHTPRPNPLPSLGTPLAPNISDYRGHGRSFRPDARTFLRRQVAQPWHPFRDSDIAGQVACF